MSRITYYKIAAVWAVGLMWLGSSQAAPLQLVATTTIVADTVKKVGGERVQITALMGPGVDPHLYRASAGDLTSLRRSQSVFYSGLHLEGKMADVLAQLPGIALGECLDPKQLINAPSFPGSHDPHIWFDVALWSQTVPCVQKELTRLDPAGASYYQAQAQAYQAELAELDTWVKSQIAQLPPERRVLVTAHDAFHYFGRAYGLEVIGLLGVSTAAEASASDVAELAQTIATRKIPAIFVETSVPQRYIEALQAAVKARGFEAKLGPPLFSDALGPADGPAGTYIDMVRTNVQNIVSSLEEPWNQPSKSEISRSLTASTWP